MSKNIICKKVLASQVSSKFRQHMKQTILERKIRPKLVGFLSNEEPASVKYAEWTSKTCDETGVDFQLVKVPKEDLEKSILKANEDSSVNGIMVYYPVFNTHRDLYLQNSVSVLKDVEGLGEKAVRNVYHNKRFIDNENTMKSVIPCTPLAIMKILEYIGDYDPGQPVGKRLFGKNITIINRSEVVGRPLAALLANEGGNVYSVDEHNVQTFAPFTDADKIRRVMDTNLKCTQVVSKSDIVITGVPTPGYKVPTKLLKPGVTAINFSSFANFESSITSKAGFFVPSVGKVTVAMLERNLLRLSEYQRQK